MAAGGPIGAVGKSPASMQSAQQAEIAEDICVSAGLRVRSLEIAYRGEGRS